MADPAIRLRLVVDGSNGAAGLDKFFAPLKREIQDLGKTAKAEMEFVGNTLELALRQLRGKSGGKLVDLGDLLRGLDTLDQRLTRISRVAMVGLGKGFQGLTASLDSVVKKLDEVAARMEKIKGISINRVSRASKGGSGGGCALSGIPIDIESAILDAVTGGATPTGAVTATVGKNGITSLVQALAGSGGTRVFHNMRTGSYRVSLPNTLQREEAVKQLASALVGAGFTFNGQEEILKQTADQTAKRLMLLNKTGTQRAWLYPQASTPYIKYEDITAPLGPKLGPGDDPDAIRAAREAARRVAAQQREAARIAAAQARVTDSMGAFTLGEQQNRDWLSAQGWAAGRNYQLGPNRMVEEFLKSGQISRLVTDYARNTSRLMVPNPKAVDDAAAPSSLRKILDSLKAIGTVPVKGISLVGEGLNGIVNALFKLSGVIYSLKHIGAILDSVLIAPWREGIKHVIDATEQYRNFELSIMGVVGGMQRAKEVNELLVRASMDLPMTVAGMQDVTRQMAFIPALTSKLALGNDQQVQQQIGDFSALVSKLSLFDPEQGPRGVMIALREAFAGEMRSLRFRLEIDPAQIAAAIGKREKDIASDPKLLMEALQAFSSNLIPDAALKELGNTYTIRMEKLREAFRHAAAMIGEGGVFDKVVAGLDRMTRSIMDYLNKGHWKTIAKRLSDDIAEVLTHVAQALLNFLKALAGVEDDSQAPEKIAETFQSITKQFADFSKSFPAWGREIGEFIRNIVSEIQMAIGQIRREIADVVAEARDPIGLQRGWDSSRSGLRATWGLATDWLTGSFNRSALLDELTQAEFGRPDFYHALGDPRRNRARREHQDNFRKIAKVLEGMDVDSTSDTWAAPGLVALALHRAGFSKAAQTAMPGWIPPEARVNAAGSSMPPPPRNWWEDPRLREGSPEHVAAWETARDILREELRFFAPKFGSIRSAATNIGDGFDPNFTAMMKAVASARTRTPGIADDLHAVGELYSGKRGGLAAGQSALESLRGLGIRTEDIDKSLSQVRQSIEDLDENYSQESKRAVEALVDSVWKFSWAISKELSSEAPEIQELMWQQITQGTTEIGTRVAEALRKAGYNVENLAMGVGGMAKDLPTLVEFQRMRISGMTQAIQAQGALGLHYRGALNVAESADAIEAAGFRPRGTRQVNERLLAYYQGEMGLAKKTYGDLQAKILGGEDSSETIAALGKARETIADLAGKMRQLQVQTHAVMQGFIQFGQQVEQALENSLGDAIYNLITGTGTLKDALVGFARDVTRAFSQMLAHDLMAGLFKQSLAAGGPGLFAGIFGPSGTAKAPLMNSTDAASKTPASVSMAANGAVWQGGFTPIMGFANGGVVNRPVVGLVGEGRYNEAIVPLPDGRSIPVQSLGGGQQTNVYVVSNMQEAVRQGFRRNKDILVDAVAGDVRRGGAISKAIRRSV